MHKTFEGTSLPSSIPEDEPVKDTLQLEPQDDVPSGLTDYISANDTIEQTTFKVTVSETKFKRYGRACLRFTRVHLLLISILSAVVLGAALGFLIRLRKTKYTTREVSLIGFPGELLMRMLKMLILPLIVSTLTSGIAGLDEKACGKMGLRAIAYITTTTILAVILGIILSVSIRPGSGSSGKTKQYGSEKQADAADSFLDLIRNIFPDNIVASSFQSYQTKRIHETTSEFITVREALKKKNSSDPEILNYEIVGNITGLDNITEVQYTKLVYKGTKSANMNVLGLVLFSVCLGIVLGQMGIKGQPLMDVLNSLADAIMRIFTIFMWYSPIGILFLIAARIVDMDDFAVLIGKVGMFTITVILGLGIQGFLTLPAIFFLMTRQNPYPYMSRMTQALVTAFGTASSSATIPVTLHCLEKYNRIDPRVSAFVVPVGATINMDGTALYEAIAVLFIAQVNNISMSFGQIVTISLTATFASIGAAGVPHAGLVTMVIVLEAVNLPVNDITLILVVDWLLDRFRTAVNVLGDSLGAGIINHYAIRELPPLKIGREFRPSIALRGSSILDTTSVRSYRQKQSLKK